MRPISPPVIASLLVLALPLQVSAQETAAATETMAGVPSGILVTTSISLNQPLAAIGPEAKQAEEDAYRRSLYQRSTQECAILLETIAERCELTSMNISTQISSSPGQSDFLYATANITLQVDLK
jgi:hypothetical protein